MSTFVFVKTVLALFYLSFLSPGLSSLLLLHNAILRGNLRDFQYKARSSFIVPRPCREENPFWCPLVARCQSSRFFGRSHELPFRHFGISLGSLCRRRDGNDHLQCKWFDKLWIDNLFPKFWMCYESFEAVTRIWSSDMFLNFHVQSRIWKDERIISREDWLILIGREWVKYFKRNMLVVHNWKKWILFAY